jgi:diguanylate cyclase (GGDEF)-like protein
MDDKGNTQILESPVPASQDATADVPGRHCLIVLAGSIPGALLPLTKGENEIGRAADSAIQLLEPSISRHHAVLIVRDQRPPVLRDEESTNGTFVNGRRLDPGEAVELADGDRLRFGSTFVLKLLRPDPKEEQFHREMFERSVRDPLTGLYNRAFFMDRLAGTAQQASGQNLGLALLMLDIDHFKRFNDTFGHEAGDLVLQDVAQVLRAASRSDDIVARFGGEEFLVALPVPDLATAMERAERIRRTLAGRRLRLGKQRTPVHITVSIGVAFAPPGRPRASGTLLSVADLHLYQAKENGRDRVVGPSAPMEASPESMITYEGPLPAPVCPGGLSSSDHAVI